VEILQGPSPSARVDRPSAVTIGFFDGVHLGHQAVIAESVRRARQDGLLAVGVTFDRHPRSVLHPGSGPPLITTPERKAELIAALGVNVLVVLRFDQELAAWPAERFVSEFLADDLQARRVTVGANFTFGNRALGTIATLHDMGPRLGFEAGVVSLMELRGRVLSSSSIREAVAAGELAWPAEALGRPFAVDGRVVTGAGRGVSLGFPTANLEIPPRMLLPGRGIYAGRAVIGEAGMGATHPAAIDVGTNPTFGDEPLHVEAFLLDFDGDLRDRAISIEFLERLRDEVRFDSPDALVRQMKEDVDRTREVVGRR
jgi:riboflavin kinase / FMN adenylyltransferase